MITKNIGKYLSRNYILIIALLVGAILRFIYLDFQSLWLDELHTMKEANPSLSIAERYDLIKRVEQMPPLYFFIVAFLFKVFGYTVFVARIFSAIVGVISIYSMYLLGKEFFNKRVGNIAALLLCFNYFHLIYSQEARPYSFFALFTILSFYRLIVLIKETNIKNAVIYGIFTALMVYGHFFGLVALVSQCVLLLFFLILSENRPKRFFSFFVGGITTLILLLPLIPIFIKINGIESFWIPKAKSDIFIDIFREFFGYSKILVTLIILSLVLFLVRLIQVKKDKLTYNSVLGNKLLFSFIILITWLIIGVAIPLIKSYLSVPVIISRYFIFLLPAVLLLAAIGIVQIKNRLLQNIFIVAYSVFFLKNIFIDREYYTSVIKSQFREVTAYLKNNNPNEDIIISNVPWHMSYFFSNKENSAMQNSLEGYINEMRADSLKIKPFWYFGGHGVQYNLSAQDEKFLKDNFKLKDNVDGWQTWARHYVLKDKDVDIINGDELEKLKDNNIAFKYNVDSCVEEGNTIEIRGWGFIEDVDALYTSIEVVLLQADLGIKVQTERIYRPDVKKAYNRVTNLEFVGFKSTIETNTTKTGDYIVGIYLKNNNKEVIIKTDRKITIKK